VGTPWPKIRTWKIPCFPLENDLKMVDFPRFYMHQPDKKICPQALKVFLFTLLMICWSATCQSEQILKQRILPSVKHGLLENPPLKNLVS
jgi:hypothetical protein